MPHRRHEYHDALSAAHASVAGGGGPGVPALTGKPTFRVAVGRVGGGRSTSAGARILAHAGAADFAQDSLVKTDKAYFYDAEDPAAFKLGRAVGTADGIAALKKWDSLSKGDTMPARLEKTNFDPSQSVSWIYGYNVGFYDNEPYLSRPLSKDDKNIGGKSKDFREGYIAGEAAGRKMAASGSMFASIIPPSKDDAYDEDESSNWKSGFTFGYKEFADPPYVLGGGVVMADPSGKQVASVVWRPTSGGPPLEFLARVPAKFDAEGRILPPPALASEVFEESKHYGPFVPPPNVPGSPGVPNLAAKLTLSTPVKWGLGLGLVGLIGFGGYRWYQTRTKL